MNYQFHHDAPASSDPGDELSIQLKMRKAIKSRFRDTEFVAVPNGTQRTAWSAINAKREGMKSGFPDGMAIWPGGIAFVEVKARSGSLSENQIDWLNRLTRMGHKAGCFRSVESLATWLAQQGAPLASAAVAA